MKNSSSLSRKPGFRGRRPLPHAVILTVLVFGLLLLLVAGAASGGGNAASAAPANTTPPAISGTAQQGRTLTAATGTWTGDAPITYAFLWQRCDSTGATCGAIAGATSATYAVQASDVGGTLRIVVTATNSLGTASAASSPTGIVIRPGQAPSPAQQPNPSGTYQVGQTISVDTGSWTGDAPITFTFQWQRCAATGANCGNIPGATGRSYLIGPVDLGLTLRAIVTASNPIGSASTSSNLTGVVSTPGTPVNTAKPTIADAGGLAAGDTATGAVGTWAGNQPINFTFSWSRCDAAGGNCALISGETKQTYIVGQGEVGRRLLFTVRASNTAGSATASSTPTAPIKASGQPAGALQLPDGRTSIPASSVSLPHRLVISEVQFSPSTIRSRTVFTARFRVADTRGYVVRDALVYLIGLPYSYVAAIPETRTGQDGYAVVNVTPTANLPLRRGGAIVFFVRARKAGESVLAGVSTRRLVQVRVARG